MQTVSTLEMLRKSLAGLREQGATIGLVPTMGALHEGHLTLIREAKSACDHVVASIFVNPTQFGPNEDLDAYPRQLAEDSAMLEGEGVSLLWAPTVEAMYPDGFATSISVSGVSEGFCGADRRAISMASRRWCASSSTRSCRTRRSSGRRTISS